MTLRATCTAMLDVLETIASASAPASPSDGVGNSRRFNLYNQNNKTLDGDTTPAIDTAVDLSFTFSGASETVDLTAAPDAKDINDLIDLTGKKLVGLIVYADPDNSGNTTMESGATNGYDFLGDAAYGLTLSPGMVHTFFQLGAVAGTDAVAAGDKTLDFAGTDGDVIQCLALFGTQS
jgi:ABC-type Fe3+ transport system substrate-binding protein